MTEPAASDFREPSELVRISHDTGEIEGALTDLWNARRLVREHGADLRYSHEEKAWLAWDGQRWQRDRTGEIARRAKATVDGLHMEGRRSNRLDSRDLLKHSIKSMSQRSIVAMIALAESEPGIPVIADELDADPWLLNVANGTLDLRTGALRSHRRGDLCTKMAPVDFDPEAACPTWDAFLWRVFDGDADAIGYLQRALGYSLTGRMTEHVLHACWGTGANGKSTLLNALAAMLGDYSQVLPADALLRKRVGSASNDIAGLRGVRLALVIETPAEGRLNEPLVKQLTGGDKVRARALYQDFSEFAPEAKYWIATNRKPVVSADDDGLWRRLRLVPFTVTIGEQERDPNLPDKLLAEMPGILAWAVRGCLAWQAQGLGTARSVTVATAAYRTEMDSVAAFLEDSCQEGEREQVGATALYSAYRSWAEATGERRISQTAFGAELARLGFNKGRAHGGAVRYRGLALREEAGERVKAGEGGEGLYPRNTNSLGLKNNIGGLVDRGSSVHPQVQRGVFNPSPDSRLAEFPHPTLSKSGEGLSTGEGSGTKDAIKPNAAADPAFRQGEGTATPCPNCSRPSVAGRPCFKCQPVAA